MLILVTRLHHSCCSSEIRASRAFYSLFFRYSLVISAVLVCQRYTAAPSLARSKIGISSREKPNSPHCKEAALYESRSEFINTPSIRGAPCWLVVKKKAIFTPKGVSKEKHTFAHCVVGRQDRRPEPHKSLSVYCSYS